MGYWNHRVFKCSKDNEEWLEIREVYYNDDHTIYAYSENAEPVIGDTIEDMRETLGWMLGCLNKEVLEESKIVCIDYSDKGEII